MSVDTHTPHFCILRYSSAQDEAQKSDKSVPRSEETHKFCNWELPAGIAGNDLLITGGKGQ